MIRQVTWREGVHRVSALKLQIMNSTEVLHSLSQDSTVLIIHKSTTLLAIVHLIVRILTSKQYLIHVHIILFFILLLTFTRW
jgi:hypothetical protein